MWCGITVQNLSDSAADLHVAGTYVRKSDGQRQVFATSVFVGQNLVVPGVLDDDLESLIVSSNGGWVNFKLFQGAKLLGYKPLNGNDAWVGSKYNGWQGLRTSV